MPYSPFQSIPLAVRPQVAQLAAEVIEQASSHGQDYWGLTPYSDAIRVNVGWTEILTALPEHMRLIVDGKLAGEAGALSGVKLTPGEDARGFYPTVPGSVCAEIPYQPATLFEFAVSALRPALSKSVQLAARRQAGRGVKAGHNQDAVQALASLVGRQLPSPGYALVSDHVSAENAELMEGALRRVVNSQYERNQAARQACIEHYGASCFVCGFSFEAAYGEFGRGFIHVHHLVPVSSIGKEYQVNPIEDLRPVCPNCHAMLHQKDPPLGIEELQALVSSEADT